MEDKILKVNNPDEGKTDFSRKQKELVCVCVGGGGGAQIEPPSTFLALNFCSLTN